MLKSNYLNITDNMNIIMPSKNLEEQNFWKKLEIIEGLKLNYADNKIYTVTFSEEAKYVLEDLREELLLIERLINFTGKPLEFEDGYDTLLSKYSDLIDYEKISTFGASNPIYFVKSCNKNSLEKIYNRNEFLSSDSMNQSSSTNINIGNFKGNLSYTSNSSGTTVTQVNNDIETLLEKLSCFNDQKINDIVNDVLNNKKSSQIKEKIVNLIGTLSHLSKATPLLMELYKSLQ